MVQGEGVEPPKAQGRQIYSLLRLTTSLSLHSLYWSPSRGLNPGPLPYHGSALPLSYLGIYSYVQTLSKQLHTWKV